jgi:hypothetical protein
MLFGVFFIMVILYVVYMWFIVYDQLYNIFVTSREFIANFL